MIHQPGLYQMPMADYLGLEMLSSGLCHLLLTASPAHARYRQQHAPGSNGAMDLGTIAHQLLLEGHEDHLVVVEADDWRTKVAREAKHEAQASGRMPILSADLQRIRAMVEVAQRYLAGSVLAGIFDRGAPEQTLLWQEGAVWCKARPDWLTDDRQTMVHFKTTGRGAEPRAFSRGPLVSYGYDVAVAFYERGLRAVCGEDLVVQSVLLVQETLAPYACALIGLSPALMAHAQRQVAYALALWEACLQRGAWPAYAPGLYWAELPAWRQPMDEVEE